MMILWRKGSFTRYISLTLVFLAFSCCWAMRISGRRQKTITDSLKSIFNGEILVSFYQRVKISPMLMYLCWKKHCFICIQCQCILMLCLCPLFSLEMLFDSQSFSISYFLWQMEFYNQQLGLFVLPPQSCPSRFRPVQTEFRPGSKTLSDTFIFLSCKCDTKVDAL